MDIMVSDTDSQLDFASSHFLRVLENKFWWYHFQGHPRDSKYTYAVPRPSKGSMYENSIPQLPVTDRNHMDLSNLPKH